MLAGGDLTEIVKETYVCAFQLSAEYSQEGFSLLLLISRNVSTDTFSKS